MVAEFSIDLAPMGWYALLAVGAFGLSGLFGVILFLAGR